MPFECTRELASRRSPPAAPPAEVVPLLGAYQDADDHSVRVRVEWRERQVLLAGERETTVLIAGGDVSTWTVRSSRHAGEAARFLRDEDGAVIGLNVGGYPYRRLRPMRD